MVVLRKTFSDRHFDGISGGHPQMGTDGTHDEQSGTVRTVGWISSNRPLNDWPVLFVCCTLI